jgi:hypothetical protein
MWTTLINIKEQKASSNIMIATQEFHAYSGQEHHDVSSFMSGLLSLSQTLETLGKKVDDIQMIGKILYCLPEHFSTFRMTWRMTKTDEATLDDLQSLLPSTEAEMKVTSTIYSHESSNSDVFLGHRNRDKRRFNIRGSRNQERKTQEKKDLSNTECFQYH